jgi:hypothetical protein
MLQAKWGWFLHKFNCSYPINSLLPWTQCSTVNHTCSIVSASCFIHRRLELLIHCICNHQWTILPTRLIHASCQLERCFILTIFKIQFIIFYVSMDSCIFFLHTHVRFTNKKMLTMNALCVFYEDFCCTRIIRPFLAPLDHVTNVLSLLHYFKTVRLASTRQCID